MRARYAIAVATALVTLCAAASGQRHPLLRSGPMCAYSEMAEVCLWVQTTQSATVRVAYQATAAYGAPAGRPRGWHAVTGSAAQSPLVRTTAAGDHIARLVLTGLQPGTKYSYRLLIDGQEIKRNYPLEFQTKPLWQWRIDPPDLTFALGSCAYINESRFDRPGRPYGGDYNIFLAIHKLRPDFMIWLGDNIYYREPDWLTPAAMRRRWRVDRSMELLQPLLGSTHSYAVWDDHDYGPNDSDRSYRLRDAALEIFNDYFPSVVRGVKEAPGCFFRFEWADVEFFMLDDRYHRSPNRAPRKGKAMLGAEQMRWLKDSLISSNARFKIVANGGQMVQPMVFYEGFGLFPDEQKELFDFIAANRIEGILFLSGDRHASELLKLQWPGASYPWYEFTCSPLTAGPGRNPREADNPARVGNTWVNQRNFGIIKVYGPAKDRRLLLACHDRDGKELWRHEIKASQLTARN